MLSKSLSLERKREVEFIGKSQYWNKNDEKNVNETVQNKIFSYQTLK